MEENTDGEHHESRDTVIPISVPQLGMKFEDEEEVWEFWKAYGSSIGFEVRKRYANKRKSDGKVRSFRYVCNKEGHRKENKKRDHLVKCPRAETRTDCQARMSLTLDREVGNYTVTDLVLEHNHMFYPPETLHLMSSQRKISDLQAFEIETADDSGIRPKAAHKLASRQVGGSANLSYTLLDHKNYLRTKRQREMVHGHAGSMLRYFQDKIPDNPSFQYALQMDCDDQITNIFWADAKMIVDYAHFGDVVTFDTTFGTNKESRPFGVFVGFNHFREQVVFGAALMYDETCDSFKWLFETFVKAHNGKHPRTIYTDQDVAMGKAIEEVFIETWHGLYTFHIMQNAAKHLPHPQNEDSNILSDFSACMFEYEDKQKFEETFNTMRRKVQTQTWLNSIYQFKEKWAECYMKDVYTLGMRSTQLSESLNSDLKDHFKSNFDMIRFLKHFERVVQGKRDKELLSLFGSMKKLPRVKIKTPILLDASKLYTPIIFEVFQAEYELSTAACARRLDGGNEYVISIDNEDLALGEEYKVIANPLEQTVVCSCSQFNRIGILCRHALKVLDLMNIKSVPPHYVLKRWTQEARHGSIQDNLGRTIVENPMFDAIRRRKYLTQKFLSLVDEVATSSELSLLVDNGLNILVKEVETKLAASPENISGHPTSVDVQTPDTSLTNARLKKREVRTRTSKRKRLWHDKKHQPRGKKSKQKEPTNDAPQAQVTENGNAGNSEQHGFLNTFTQLLMNPSINDLYSEDLF